MRKHSNRPTAEEINLYDSLDERCAVVNFLGKDLQEAQSLFRENFLYYQEDLMWMGPKAFCFYVAAAIRHLLSSESDGDPGAVSSFCMVVEFRWEHDSAQIASAKPALREGILRILERFDRYDCDRDIHGNVAHRLNVLVEKMSR